MEKLSQTVNPLLPLHRQREAEMLNYGQVEIVNTFGEPQAEYAAIHKACGMMDRPHRGMLELIGHDRLAFLNGLISNTTYDKNSKQPIAPATRVYSFMLNLKGRIVCDMTVLELGQRTLLEMDLRLVEPMRALFEQYHFAEQVTLKSRVGELHEIALYGPASASVLQHAGTVDVFVTSINGIECVGWYDDPTGSTGLNLILATDQAQALWEYLLTGFGQSPTLGKRSLRPVGWAAFNACRVEAGRPLFGIDFDGVAPRTASPIKKQQAEAEANDSVQGVLPAETGVLYERATSLTKCYIGQEIVARMHARQVVARKIVGIRMEGDALPIAGAPIQDDAGNQIGIVTSSTVSPILSNAAICLGFVKRPHFETGTKLLVPAEGAQRVGFVVPTPFVPSPGAAGAGD